MITLKTNMVIIPDYYLQTLIVSYIKLKLKMSEAEEDFNNEKKMFESRN